MKKAVLEVQFNWIFILIVGAVILAFFVNVVYKAKGHSTELTDANTANALNTITAGAQVSKGTTQMIQIKGLEVGFSARDCLREETVGSGTKALKDKIVFAPTVIGGSDLIAWTIPWDMPYRLTNFVMMTSPQMRYVLAYATPLDEKRFALSVNKTLPQTMYKDFYGNNYKDMVLDNGNYKVRLVIFDNNGGDPNFPPGFNSAKDSTLSALVVQPDTTYSDVYILNFYGKKGTSFSKTGTTYALSKTALYAAIFTDNFDIYNCNMKEAFKKMYFVNKIILNRTNTLSDLEGLTNCGSYYLLARSSINSMMINATYLNQMFPGDTSKDRVKNIFKLAFDQDNSLQRYNADLQLHSCPEIY